VVDIRALASSSSASHQVILSPRDPPRACIGYLVPRLPSGVSTPLGISKLWLYTPFLRGGWPLTDFGPYTETPPGCCLRFPTANRRFSSAPPLRFLPLQRSSSGESARCPVPTRAPSLFDLFQVLEGFLLTGSCGPISCRCRSWGSHPSELLSYRRTLLDSSSSDPLSAFLRFSEEIRPCPQGFL